MYEKLYLVDESELKRIEKVPALSYKEIYDAVISTKEEKVRKKLKLDKWLEFKW
jgi:hypothetical protein